MQFICPVIHCLLYRQFFIKLNQCRLLHIFILFSFLDLLLKVHSDRPIQNANFHKRTSMSFYNSSFALHNNKLFLFFWLKNPPLVILIFLFLKLPLFYLTNPYFVKINPYATASSFCRWLLKLSSWNTHLPFEVFWSSGLEKFVLKWKHLQK